MQVHDAVALMLATWDTERRHEQASTYRYAELAGEGLGPPSNYTGGQRLGGDLSMERLSPCVAKPMPQPCGCLSAIACGLRSSGST